MQKSTFIRKGKNTTQLPKGTKPSVFNGQVLISSGLQELDQIFGGGLAIGSLVCIKEDKLSQYNRLLLQYFISEGISQGHVVCSVTTNTNEKKFIQELPLNYTVYRQNNQNEPDEEEEKERSSNELKIAWRYKEFVDKKIQEKKYSIQKIQKTTGTVDCHQYDLSKNIQEDILKENQSKIHTIKENNLSKLYEYLSGLKG